MSPEPADVGRVPPLPVGVSVAKLDPFQRLKPLDRQIIVSYLEGMDASSIVELTGLSPANIAMKVNRIKNILRRWFVEGGLHAK